MEHSHDSVQRGARGASVTVAFPVERESPSR